MLTTKLIFTFAVMITAICFFTYAIKSKMSTYTMNNWCIVIAIIVFSIIAIYSGDVVAKRFIFILPWILMFRLACKTVGKA